MKIDHIPPVVFSPACNSFQILSDWRYDGTQKMKYAEYAHLCLRAANIVDVVQDIKDVYNIEYKIIKQKTKPIGI